MRTAAQLSLLAGLLLSALCSFDFSYSEASLESTDAVFKVKRAEGPMPFVRFNTGYTSDGTPLFATRALILGGNHIGYVRQNEAKALFSVFSYQKQLSSYEVMVSANGRWEKLSEF